MAKHINLEGDKLILTFPFDTSVVAAIRALDGRQWVAGKKRWEVPKENVSDVISKLSPLGFTPSIDVVKLKREEDKLREEIENIKLSDGVYEGTLPLYAFQKKGANFLKQMPHALLADVPGLGKSIQTIAALEGNTGPHLILVPASLKFSWATEIEKWSKTANVRVITGENLERRALWAGVAKTYIGYVVANYELLLHDFDLIKDIPWETIVCDEATRISNPLAKTTKALKLLKAKKRIALTGTPVSNSPEDVFSIIDWLAPRYLGTFYQFRDKYCIMDDVWHDRVVSYKNLEELATKVDRFMLRRTKEQVFDDFPPKTTEHLVYELSADEKRLYQYVKDQVIEEIKKITYFDTRSLNLVPVQMLRLKQVTGHAKLLGEHPGLEAGHIKSSKLELLKDTLEPIIKSGDKAIIFTQFAEMLHIMREELKEYNPLTIYGEVSDLKRMEYVNQFNKDPNIKLIIMTEAGAYGLNMQAASYVIHYDAPWSLAKLLQREDRAHRIGQKKPVTVYHLIGKGTIDEYILKVLKKKGAVSDKILQDIHRSALTKEDIDEILDI